MVRFLRLVVLWLMAVAIPAQGLAAAVMPLCGSAEATWMLNEAAQHHAGDHTADAGRSVLDATASGHVQGHSMAPDALEPPTTDDASGSDQAGHGMLKCCSVGCALAVSHAALANHSSPLPALGPAQSEVTMHAGVVLDGLDRPPRHRLL